MVKRKYNSDILNRIIAENRFDVKDCIKSFELNYGFELAPFERDIFTIYLEGLAALRRTLMVLASIDTIEMKKLSSFLMFNTMSTMLSVLREDKRKAFVNDVLDSMKKENI